jgi:hypothetical protein
MALTFLVASVSARWLQARTTLRPTWTALAAFGVALSLGLLNLRLVGLSLRAPLLAALGAGVCLLLLLIWGRRLQADPGVLSVRQTGSLAVCRSVGELHADLRMARRHCVASASINRMFNAATMDGPIRAKLQRRAGIGRRGLWICGRRPAGLYSLPHRRRP